MEHMLQACTAHNQTDQHFLHSIHAGIPLHDLIVRNNLTHTLQSSIRRKGGKSGDGEFKET
jgi:hypothetical protein